MLKLGDRVQVQWDVENSEVGGTVAVWWGATVKSTGASGDSYVIRYDAMDDQPEVDSHVKLQSPFVLYDTQEGDTLFWRMEGSAFDASSSPALENSTSSSMTMIELLQDQLLSEHAEQEGGSVHDLGMQALSQLPYQHQSRMAMLYRNFSDLFRQELQQLLHERGRGAVVRASDVSTILSQVNERLESQLQ